MRLIIVFLLSMATASCIHAQEKFQYSTQNYVGLLEGQNKGAFQLQTIHGVKYRGWYAGAGTGLDYYMYRSIPVFLDVNKDLVFNNRTFFVSGDVGTNFAWVSKNTHAIWGGQVSDSKFSPQLYWSGGLGYRAIFKNNREAFLLNIGYSFKHIREEITQTMFCREPPCQVSKDVYDYRLNRLSVKVGLQF